MELSQIKAILSGDEIAANQVNPLIEYMEVQWLDQLTDLEKGALQDLINNMLMLSQDTHSGAYLNNPAKAELLLEALG
ncbi:hypothetical protein D0810_18990 [Vibrio cholerae]|uniref:hypothetical protein n=1 Tax=Vibrio cholerae TaxID=666 RepID=UPI000B9604DE|nr:hypothetical protein [Vibrio cholerae]AWB72260.1 hypothetical protein Sa5Y_VCA03158 [Vibrio cholerae]EGQ7691987.1 hypothetical protein [Vibrio cholerae]EGQ8395067.1 hypothetical protein [Vibrio cholerae]EGQ9579756.1 hypothetical protein [Vibrio cholerae]EGQ9963569.1 hypothetical protein [Vibrio cholerae]